MLRRASRRKSLCCSCQALIAKHWCDGGLKSSAILLLTPCGGLMLFARPPIIIFSFLLPLLSQCGPRSLYENRVLPACGGKGERSIMSSCRNVIMSSCHHAVKDFGIGVSVSVDIYSQYHFLCHLPGTGVSLVWYWSVSVLGV